MINYPKTMEDAQRYRYGDWAGNPMGNKYRAGFCAMEVWPNCRGPIPHQCNRKNGHGPEGLYCKQHAKELGAEAKEAL
jgi:hypothetical protein